MPVVSGTLQDIGAGAMTGLNVRVILRPEEVSFKGSIVMPTKEIVATVGTGGAFSFPDVRASLENNPYTPYVLAIEWQDTGGNYTRTDFPTFRIVVPAEGGNIGDMVAEVSPSKIITKGEDGNVVQQEAIDALIAEDVVINGKITGHGTRLTSVESKNTTQDTRLTSVESVNTTQDGRITATEAKNTTQDGRLTGVESVNTTQDTRLTGVETKNTAQDVRLATLEDLQPVKAVRLEAGQWVWDVANATHYLFPEPDGGLGVHATAWPKPNPTTPTLDW